MVKAYIINMNLKICYHQQWAYTACTLHKITISTPNANLQEHFILALHLMQKLPIENFILPVVFDDLRENKIRKGVENIFNDEISKNFIVGSSATGRRLYNNYLSNNKDNYDNFKDNKTQSFQENTEKYLNKSK